jgi:tetratricopeptide (TPR) repeat protein
MASGDLDHGIMNCQAEGHKLRSEYIEAYNIQSQILQEAPVDQDPHVHAFALLNLVEIDLSIGIPKDDLQSNIDAAKSLSDKMQDNRLLTACDCYQADLNLQEGDILGAKTLFCKCLRATWGKDAGLVTYCLEKLGDVNHWNTSYHEISWTIVFLAYSLKSKDKLGIYKALQFLGDVFLAQDDGDTAISLLTLALEGFAQMDVHRNRAECMLQLGDIFKGNGNLLKAVDLWETARPLFERSSQAKQVDHIDERLAGVGEDVLKQHRKNLAHLVKLSALPSTIEELDDHQYDVKDLQMNFDNGEGQAT